MAGSHLYQVWKRKESDKREKQMEDGTGLREKTRGEGKRIIECVRRKRK